MQNAGDELVLAVGTQFVALPRLVDPFLNCTVPVGPAPLLVVMTVAVSVMLPPEVIEDGLGTTWVFVAALVTVNVRVVAAAGAM